MRVIAKRRNGQMEQNVVMDAENLGLYRVRTNLGSAQVGSSWQGLGSALLVSAWLHFAWLGLAVARG